MKVTARVGAGLLVGLAAASAVSQSSSTGQAAPYTLQVQSRVVLTDVTVLDRRGNPVRGLSERDFQVLDNGRPQKLASFEEHLEQKSMLRETAATPNGFSNDFLRHPPAQVNVLLFDTTTIGILDQMYLFEQMRRFVQDLPAGQPVAVFTRSGDVTVQLAGFTDDHAKLLAAIREAIPRMRQPGAWSANDTETLRQMAFYLSQVPGRKNLLWFTSGSNLYLRPDPTEIADTPDPRVLYDTLEAERIAIYPIDARGLSVGTSMMMAAQQIQMREDAEATGGEATVNTNGLALAAARIVATDGDYYTLTYSPDDVKNNGKWHRVEVKLSEGGYRLSYRRGYYDDGVNGAAGAPGKTRTMLRVDGGRVEVPNERSEPIVFRAQLVPAPSVPGGVAEARPKRGEARYAVQFVVPARDLAAAKVQGSAETMIVGTAVLAFDRNGEPAARSLHKVTLRVDAEKARTMPHATVTVHESVDLPVGRNYLYLGLWDTTTGRMGMVNAEVDVKKP